MPSEAAATARWLTDMRHHIAKAERFMFGMNYEMFNDDVRTLYAVTRCLEIISEASRRLPDELKARHAAIEWREMAAAGNVYRHDYEDVESSMGVPDSHRQIAAVACGHRIWISG